MNKHLDKLKKEFERAWANPVGFRALTIVNHNNIGIRFMVTGSIFFLIGGLLAMLIRAQLALPNQHILDAKIYNQVFSMHGTVMMFLFAVPTLEGMAIYLIPKMIGARDLVFPRIGAFGYFCYLFGGIILLSSMVLGMAPDTGWFMYTPLTNAIYSPGKNADFWLISITFIEISAITTAIELIVSILYTRTNKMSLKNMPLYCWYIIVMAFMILFGFPPLILGSILLEFERIANMPFFTAAAGGDAVLWQHLFWLFGHPDVYILFLPAAGIISTIIPTFSRRPIVGYYWIVLAIILLGFISFGLWVHHMFTVGIPQLAQVFFSVASMLAAIPTGIQLFAWIATLMMGKPLYRIPMLWAVGFLIIFVIGGLTGVMLALVPFDWQVHDTHFVVAHMHYVLVGGVIFPLIAGLYYWLPLVSGKMPSEKLSHWAFWLVFIGFNLTFLIMHLTGLLGMPRRIYSYEAGLGWEWTNFISSIGSFIMSIGFFMILFDLVFHFRFGEKANQNPWNSGTLEWATQTPPENYTFLSLPDVKSPYPLWDDPELPTKIAQGKCSLAKINHQQRETWGSHPVSGEAYEVIRLPGNTWLPFLLALMLGIVCINLLITNYLLSALALLISIAIIIRWAWKNGAYFLQPDEVEKQAPSLHPPSKKSPGLWGMYLTLLADGAFYMSLLFAWLYLWTVAPLPQIPSHDTIPWLAFLIDSLLLTATALLFNRGVQQKIYNTQKALSLVLWITVLLSIIQCGIFLWIWQNISISPSQTAHDAVITVMLTYLFIHCIIATMMTAQLALRLPFGYVGKQFPHELYTVKQWWLYTVGIFWLSYGAMVLLPLSWSFK